MKFTLNWAAFGVLVLGIAAISPLANNVFAQTDFEPGSVPAKGNHAEPQSTPARGGQIIRVGSDSLNCDFSTLVDAIDAAQDGDSIRLQSDAVLYEGDLHQVIGTSLTIEGGYTDCEAATPTGRTTLDGLSNGRVLAIAPSGQQTTLMTVVLRNLVIRGGLEPHVYGGAGVLVFGRQGRISVVMENVAVTDNTATGGHGGGVAVIVDGARVASGTMLTMDNESSLKDNTSAQNGGGLACRNPDNHSVLNPLIRLGAIEITSNTAVNGGGISVENCRNVIYYSGGPVVQLDPTAAMAGNVASENGGGFYVEGESALFINGRQFNDFGDSDYAAHLVVNQAERGGAGYVTGADASVAFSDVVMAWNSATLDGGGVFVNDQATMLFARTQNQDACQPSVTESGQTSVPRCSRAAFNFAERDGGAFFLDSGQLEVERTIISDNLANGNGSVVAARGTETDIGKARFDDSLVHGNTGTRLFYAWTNSDILVRWSTITDNNSPNDVFRAFTNTGVAQVRVATSIIWEEGGNIITTGGTGDLNAIGECILGHQDLAEIDATINFYHVANPMLFEVDETRPYFPGPTSPAIDFCHGNQATGEPDLAGEDRGTAHTGSDLTNPPSWSGTGTYDIGAYETDWEALTDEIFQDQFQAQ